MKCQKKSVQYTCIACINGKNYYKNGKKKKNYPQVSLKECKCKIKNIKISEFKDVELESDPCPDSE